MEFRPCIDIHNGKVKQIVGSSLKDAGNFADENFVADKTAGYYAGLYFGDGIKGAHVIMLNASGSEYYEATKAASIEALETYPGGLQVGGGIKDTNASEFIDKGASHVIVTSFAFSDGKIQYDNLEKLVAAVGREHIVLDLSAGMKDGHYLVVTDRWQKYTDAIVDVDLFVKLSEYCDEFLVHGIDAEGKRKGPDFELVNILSAVSKAVDVPITYAGGISSMEDIRKIQEISGGRLNFTVGSALDLFGGNMEFDKVVDYCKSLNMEEA